MPGVAALPTAARAVLETSSGRTTRGLIVTSTERGPQVSLFIPPGAFSAAGTGAVVVEAAAVRPTGEGVPGRAVSNVYELRARSAARRVSVTPGVQPMSITLRGFEAEPSVVTVFWRAAGQAWHSLPTSSVGHHLHHAEVPGEGEFVLSAAPVPRSGDRSWGWWVGGLLGALALALAVGRWRTGYRRRAQEGSPSGRWRRS